MDIKKQRLGTDTTKVFKSVEDGGISPSAALKKIIELSMPKEQSIATSNVKGTSIEDYTIEEAIDELDALIGLTSVKELVKELLAFIEIQRRRKELNLTSEPLVLHMIFKGNPGTGKTTVARLLGKIFKKMDILQKGHLIEVERADIVGEYIGHTAQKVREQIKKAMGGILFIDEAYSLARGGEKDFGKEAIDTLVKGMEDYKDSFILILAGYQNEMDNFLKINPGLKSRFPIHINFEDYKIDELLQIAEITASRREYILTKGAKARIGSILSLKGQNNISTGNARMIRNIVEKAVRKQAVRLMKKSNLTKEDLITIEREDILEVD